MACLFLFLYRGTIIAQPLYSLYAKNNCKFESKELNIDGKEIQETGQ